jgi:hypothetical protein
MSRFLRWFERIAHPERELDNSGVPEDLLHAARVAAAAAPRLRHVPDYPARLADAAAVALDYARTLADELGEPVVLDKGAWDRNPLIPIIVTSPEEGFAFLQGSLPLRRVFAEPGTRNCHFLLAMRRQESTTFGYEQAGEVLHRDVLQTAVSFTDHQVIAAARTGQEVREHFVEHVLRYLAGVVPASLQTAEESRTGLREALDLTRREAQTLDLQLRQEDPYAETRKEMQGIRDKLQGQADELERTLASLPEQPAGDEDFLLLVRKVLLHPRRHLGWKRITMRVQDFGVLVREKDSTTGRKISFLEFTPGNGPAYAVFFARLGRDAATILWPDLATGTGRNSKA